MKNKLDIINFSRLYDLFGERVARIFLKLVNLRLLSEKVLEHFLYRFESKAHYTARLRMEFKNLK